MLLAPNLAAELEPRRDRSTHQSQIQMLGLAGLLSVQAPANLNRRNCCRWPWTPQSIAESIALHSAGSAWIRSKIGKTSRSSFGLIRATLAAPPPGPPGQRDRQHGDD